MQPACHFAACDAPRAVPIARDLAEARAGQLLRPPTGNSYTARS
jgi:hypothetical protein